MYGLKLNNLLKAHRQMHQNIGQKYLQSWTGSI